MVAAVLLAAGEGSRFDGTTHKLLAPLRGRPVFSHALDAAVESGLEVFVVTGAVDLHDLVPAGVHLVPNPKWSDGQATSVAAGITAASMAGHDAVVIGLGDEPFVTADAWRAVAASDTELAVATYGGERGHPVKLARSVWHLLPGRGDVVGRAVMRNRPELVREIPCPGDIADIDTVEDLRRWS